MSEQLQLTLAETKAHNCSFSIAFHTRADSVIINVPSRIYGESATLVKFTFTSIYVGFVDLI